DSQPVTASMKSSPAQVQGGETFEVRVNIEIAAAHYLYASNAVGKPFTPVTLRLALPRGIEPVGHWVAPTPIPRKSEFVYADSILFRHALKVSSNVPEGRVSITSELQYQACTEELC